MIWRLIAVLLLSVIVLFGAEPTGVASASPRVHHAYIGPGAGIALVGSFLAVLTALFSAVVAIVTWPVRRIWLFFRGRRAMQDAHVRRVVIVGLDGLDPDVAERFLAEGLLPNLKRLQHTGSYQRLGTTFPPLSPVAWSSFSTGTNPGKHNIFDFLSRNPKTYGPSISSVRIRPPRRTLRVGPYRIPLSRPEIRGLRRSKPFWALLGEASIFSAVLRVPITFPCDRFAGVQLAAMCVPDLLGTQGTFTLYTDNGDSAGAPSASEPDPGGRRIAVQRDGKVVRSYLEGPANSIRRDNRTLRIDFTLRENRDGSARVDVAGQRFRLQPGSFSPWIRLAFPLAPGMRLRGICRLLLKQLHPHLKLYATPIQIDPDHPAMPISHPTVYSSYLARSQGSFATLGLAEDTWALSEDVLSDDDFLDQAYQIHEERKTMFFDALDRVRRGMIVCVFDGPDRIQHMFWRYHDADHPALRGRPNTHPTAIRDMYVRMDKLVGETLDRLEDDTAVLVMSDHGFKPFRRGVDLNRWLLDNGYLVLKGGARCSERSYLVDVDWEQTRAFALGLAGLFVNQRDREACGIVEGGRQRDALVAEIARKLTGLTDPDTGAVAIHEAVPREQAYAGPYTENAPDVIVGYDVGYRVSWESAVGKTAASVFSDNTKAWSGDHSIHPERVPGVLFSNRKLAEGPADITDVAPTALELLGLGRPAYMDGKSLLCNGEVS